MRLCLIFSFILLSSATAMAQLAPELLLQSEPVEEEEEIRYYSIEVIVFEHSDPASAGNEIFDPEPVEDQSITDAEQLIDGSIPVYSDGSLAPYPDTASVGDSDVIVPPDAFIEEEDLENIEIAEIRSLTSLGYRLLTEEELTMTEIHEKLSRLNAYQPLLWGGWIQAAVDEESTSAVRLRMLGAPPLTLSGEFTLYLKNYLHLVVDLGLEHRSARFEPLYRQEKPSPPGSGTLRTNDPGGSDYTVHDWQITRYAIEEDRIFNSGHLRYFDHPRFGALVRVNRVESPEPAEPEDPDNEMLPDENAVAMTGE